MPINLACHGCDKSFSVPDHFAGKSGKCKHCCGTPLDVPAFVPAPPLVVVQDGPIRLMARRRRKPAAIYITAVVLVAWAILSAISYENTRNRTVTTRMIEAPIRAASRLCGLAVIFGPIVLPAALSRRRILSSGRWLILATFCAISAALLMFLWYLIDTNGGTSYGGEYPGLAVIMGLIFFGLVSGFPGCLLAAAVYPKSN